jgi:hypothetical protein
VVQIHPPQPKELIENKQVKREPENWLPSFLAKLSVFVRVSHWTAADGMVMTRSGDELSTVARIRPKYSRMRTRWELNCGVSFPLATFRIASDEFRVQTAGGDGIQLHQFAMPSCQRALGIPTGTSGHADSWRTARGKALCSVDLRRHVG